jgi:hypothetical protein
VLLLLFVAVLLLPELLPWPSLLAHVLPKLVLLLLL